MGRIIYSWSDASNTTQHPQNLFVNVPKIFISNVKGGA